MIILRGILGIAALLAMAWALSTNRRRIPWRVIVWGLGLQIVFALIILKTAAGQVVFDTMRRAVVKAISFSGDGAGFLFGILGKPNVDLNMLDSAKQPVSFGFAVAFQVLPVIVFFSSLIAVLYHFGIMQRIVAAFAWVMRRTMKISGAESLAVSAEIFLGNVESPLTIRPYLADMTVSELGTVMTAGFATIAGSVMAAYAGFGIDPGHLLTASVMSAPAAVVIAKLIYPETQTPKTMDGAKTNVEKETVNVIDAAAAGAIQGLKIAAVVGAMLVAFISFIALINYLLGLAHTSMGEILGYVFAPVAFCMGVDSGDVLEVGRVLGTKIGINELVAYLDLLSLKDQISPRSFTIATYALCGFANFGSIAIAIGGIGQIAPSRRLELARMGFKTMLGGAMASMLTASIAGMMI